MIEVRVRSVVWEEPENIEASSRPEEASILCWLNFNQGKIIIR
jgi:hypothetical protein